MPPVRVPLRRIPAHYRDKVSNQLQLMFEQGVIKHSSSSWMAPAVFDQKKSGDIRLCVDYRALNKRTSQDVTHFLFRMMYRISWLVQQYFQHWTWDEDTPSSSRWPSKDCFSPGPGMGLSEFCCMPFGLAGAPGSFQRLMDTVLHGLPFVVIYLL